MCMGGEIGNDLICCNAVLDGPTDALTSYASRYHIGVTSGEFSKESEDGDLEWRGGIGV